MYGSEGFVTLDPTFRFACPVDGGPLHWDEVGVTCLTCARSWPRRGAVPVFQDPSGSPEAEAVAESVREPTPDARRNDWRFLFPADDGLRVLEIETGSGRAALAMAADFAELAVVTATEHRAVELREEALALGLDHVSPVVASIVALPFPEDAFDAVVLHDSLDRFPAGKEGDLQRLTLLRRLRARVAPGGVLWIEASNRWAPSSSGGTHGLDGLRRLLVRTGWETVEEFARGADRRDLIPLDDPTVQDWRLAQASGDSRRDRISSLLARGAFRAGLTPRRVPAFGMLARRPQPAGARPGPPSILAEISRALRAQWPSLAADEKRPARLRYWLDSADPSPHGCLRALPFAEGGSRPIARVKVARDGTAALRLRREHEFLRDLEREAPASTGSLFPRAIALVERGSQCAAGHTRLPGAAPDPADPPHETLAAAGRWLRAFWRATGMLPATERALWEPLLRAVRAASDDPADPAAHLFADLVEEIESRDGVALASCGHGSFRVSRLRVDRDRIGAVEWEHGVDRQFPWIDAIELALDLARSDALARDVAPEDGFTRLWLGDGEDADALRSFLATALEEAAASPEVLPLAVPAVALAVARRAERRAIPDDPEPHDWRALARQALHLGTRHALESIGRAHAPRGT